MGRPKKDKPKRLCHRCKTQELPKYHRKYCDTCKPLAEAEYYLQTLARARIKVRSPEERERDRIRSRAQYARQKRLHEALLDLPADQLLAFIEFDKIEPAPCHVSGLATGGEFVKRIPEKPSFEVIYEEITAKYTKKGTLKC